MSNILKKTFAIVALVAVIFTNIPVYVFAASADTAKPTVNISRPNASSVYAGETITYTLYLADNVGIAQDNVYPGNINLHGFTATKKVSGTGGTRTVTLSNIQGTAGSGKYISVNAGALVDAAGNKSNAASSFTFELKKKAAADTAKPTVNISRPNVSSVYIGETVTYTLYLADNVGIAKDNTASMIDLNGFTAKISVSGDKSQKTVTLSNIQGTVGTGKTITVKAGALVDAAGNKSNAASSYAFELKKKVAADTAKPTVNISRPNVSSVYVGETVTYTLYLADNVGIAKDNTASMIDLNGFTAKISVSGDKSQKTVTLSNIQGTVGTGKTITVKAGALVDAAGNKSNAVSSYSFEIKKKVVADTAKPTVNISRPTPESVYAGETVRYTVYIADNVAIKTVNIKDNINVHGFKANVSVSGDDKVQIVTLSNIQGNADADNYISINAGAVVDTSNNKSNAVSSYTFTIKEKAVTPIEPEPEKDTIAPVVKIGAANPKSIYAGGTVTYNVTFSDNVKVTSVNLTADKIDLVGFTADVSVKVDGLKSAVVTLKNVKGNAGVNKYIKIDAGVALDQPGNRSAQAISPKFSIVKKASTIVGTKPTVTKYTTNCIDDLSLLGDINKEITYFASWLRAEKYTATHVQENNYVAEDETMTYMVEYYNGSTAPAPEVKFDLTIPYKVVVEEINGNGKITKQTDNETVITWNVGTVPSYAASQGRGYCRLYVRVRFLENEPLEKSDKISETFYATLKTTADGNHSYSYMRQLFIDTTEGKTGIYKSYLTTVDTTNQVRPDDEITRAEFAKLLADSGILDVKVGSNDYKTFKDHEKIPAYARDAVSALVKTDIIQAFPDGEFKPNNPILMEDAMQMIAQAATYISEQKLTVYKPVFLYTEALTGKDKKVSPKKDYIMELMRQNVVVKYESNPDTYALRKHVVAMVNSLTFRGPYVEKLPENTLKFADIRDDSVFFYNIVGASNSYKYTYDYRLWQQIVEIVK